MNPKDYKKEDKRKLSILKRKLGIDKETKLKPGDMLEKLNEKKLLAIKGLV